MTAGAGTLAPTVRIGGLPLAGIEVHRCGTDDVVGVAGELLGSLGATVIDADVARAVATPPAGDAGAGPAVGVVVTSGAGRDHEWHTASTVPVTRLLGELPDRLPGLPVHTIPYACGLALAGGAVLALSTGRDVDVDASAVAIHVVLPEVLAAEYRAPHRAPAPPRVLAGGGALACDLASADDEDALHRVLELLGPGADARAVADEAQAWRLPVCAYLSRSGSPRPFTLPRRPPAASPASHLDMAPARDRSAAPAAPPLAGISVCDLTAMWAGPLATWLLAEAGATVHKIESRVRHDGMRGLDGGGIHPPGADASTGTTSAMFNALNRRKSCLDLDLRDPADRAVFVELVRSSDLVVDSFSRRVMPNLGYSPRELRELAPGIGTLSIPAFPPDHAWQVALGPGVHAASGLGEIGPGRFAQPVVAYPDPLAGLVAFAVAAALVLGRRRGITTGHAEVSLFDVTEALARRSPTDPIVRARDRRLGSRFLDQASRCRIEAWEHVDDGAGRHRYPRAPFRGAWHVPPPTPAPAIGERR